MNDHTTMRSHLYRATTFALYQFSLFVGITLLPVAVAMRQLGITLPVHRVIGRFGSAYEKARAASA